MRELILLERIDALERSLERVETGMKSVEDQVKNQLGERVWATCWNCIMSPAQDCKKELESICEQLMSKEADIKDAWEKYSSVYEKSEDIFDECLDFLGGLAMRDRGMYKGICDLSDELMDRCDIHTDVHWYSLTVPAQQEPMKVSSARIIRLRFPERTIWSLPLAAHQFGLLAVELKDEWRHLVDAKAEDETEQLRLKNLLSDGLATCLMGPAYACATILLSLDPLKACAENDEHIADAERAYVVFAMLERLRKKGDVAESYEPIIQKLKDKWNAALQWLGPHGELKEADKEQLDDWIETIWQKLFVKLLPGALYCPDEEGWRVAKEWHKQLLQKKSKSIQLKGDESLRDALNAAWLCRIKEPDRIREIEDEACDFCERIVAKRLEIKSKGKTKKQRKLQPIKIGR